jgi:2-hydroxycyclohexanecarboxyl-CoA dehydrogenase
VTDLARVDAAIAEAVTAFGRLDVLVNNAGWTPNEPFAGSAPETWRRVVDVNYMGVLNCTRAALTAMIPARRGRIVSIASDAGRVGTPREAVYAGAKAAIVGFSKSLARELARDRVPVNVICPGPVDTALLKDVGASDLGARIVAGMTNAIPFRRLGTPEEIADAVAFFASPAAGFITGQVLSVSGGLTMAG